VLRAGSSAALSAGELFLFFFPLSVKSKTSKQRMAEQVLQAPGMSWTDQNFVDMESLTAAYLQLSWPTSEITQ
jgi:hypothetical protein